MGQRPFLPIDINSLSVLISKGRSDFPVHMIRPFALCICMFALFLCAGCATARIPKEPDAARAVTLSAQQTDAPAEVKPVVIDLLLTNKNNKSPNIVDIEDWRFVIGKGKVNKKSTAPGIIFGKADFRGLLKVQYVKLNIVDEDDPEKQYELLFGDRDENNAPVWDARPVEPHYFFLELPVGRYRITAISIPVGTTLATETTDIAFTVKKETVIYLGTLRVTGTDQKIRFGGVPLLRPGFAYKVEILNEIEEAVHKFRLKYPSMQREIQVQLMRAMRVQTF